MLDVHYKSKAATLELTFTGINAETAIIAKFFASMCEAIPLEELKPLAIRLAALYDDRLNAGFPDPKVFADIIRRVRDY